MADEAQATEEVAPEVVQSEVEQTEASEATESTKGQVESQPAEGEEGEKPDKPEEKTSPSKARRERRKAEMERRKESEAELRRELERTQAQLERIKNAAQSTQPPKEDDFQDYAEYQAALAAHKSMQAFDDRQRREVEEEATSYQQRLKEIESQSQREAAENWAAQVQEAKTRYADFEQVAQNPALPINQHMAEVISNSDMGADVAYYLGQNPQEAAQIAQMKPMDAARMMGMIEARLSLPRAKTTTETPDPIDPVKPKASAGAKDPSKMTMAEYRKWRGF